MSYFNLVDEPWIPVRFPGGDRAEVGLREVLLRSADIATIEDPSPLVVAALHRLLLAVLYRALEGPTDSDEAMTLFNKGVPADRIDSYLDRWHDRFWLFDERYPFWQVADFQPKEARGQQLWKPWTVLAMEHNGDNSKVLADHVSTAQAGEVITARAARWLTACQTFTPGGGNSDFKYTRSGPSASAVMAVPLGRNLQDTLLLMLVPENREILAGDLPVWERDVDSTAWLREGPERAATGWADLYTWRSRSIKLRLDGEGETVGRVAFASGVGWLSGGLIDPMIGYRIDDERGRLPVQFRDRGLWRDFDSLLPDESDLAPRVLENARTLTRGNASRAPGSILVLGQATNKAKIEYWRMERFEFPSALAGDQSIRRDVRRLLDDAEGAGRQLWAACSSFARHLLGRGDREPAGGDKKAFVRQLSASPWFWATLESRFHDGLRDMTLDRDPDDTRREWLVAVRTALAEAWGRHCAAVAHGDAWAIRALIKAERPVRREMKRLQDELLRLTPQPEEA